jgi:hypothetical protein
MAAEISAGLGFFMPIFSFLLVFVIVYALLAKTQVLGENKFVHLLISFLLAIFFIVNVSLVEFVNFNSAWFAVFIVCIFFILLLISFTHGKIDFFQKAWVAWILIAGLIVFFIISSAYVFAWSVNWDSVENWFSTDWFGFVLLLVIAAIVSAVLYKMK